MTTESFFNELLPVRVVELRLQEVVQHVVADAAREDPLVGVVLHGGVRIDPLEARRQAEPIAQDDVAGLGDGRVRGDDAGLRRRLRGLLLRLRAVREELREHVQSAEVEQDVAAEAEDPARPAVAVEAARARGDAELAVVEIFHRPAGAPEGLAREARRVGEAVEAVAEDGRVLDVALVVRVVALEAIVDAGVVVEPARPEVALEVGAELVERRHRAHGEGPLDERAVSRPDDRGARERNVVRADDHLEELEAVVAEPRVVEEERAEVIGVELARQLERDLAKEPPLEAEARAAHAKARPIRRVARLERGVLSDVGDGLRLQQHHGLDREGPDRETEELLELGALVLGVRPVVLPRSRERRATPANGRKVRGGRRRGRREAAGRGVDGDLSVGLLRARDGGRRDHRSHRGGTEDSPEDHARRLSHRR